VPGLFLVWGQVSQTGNKTMAIGWKQWRESPKDLVKITAENDGDPVYKNQEGFWFYNEVWIECCGPYDTEADARIALGEYAKTL
jgi:hypothetical protein